jgi:hypothetical protein
MNTFSNIFILSELSRLHRNLEIGCGLTFMSLLTPFLGDVSVCASTAKQNKRFSRQCNCERQQNIKRNPEQQPLKPQSSIPDPGN